MESSTAEKVQEMRGKEQCTPSPRGCCSKRSAVTSTISDDVAQVYFDYSLTEKRKRKRKSKNLGAKGGRDRKASRLDAISTSHLLSSHFAFCSPEKSIKPRRPGHILSSWTYR